MFDRVTPVDPTMTKSDQIGTTFITHIGDNISFRSIIDQSRYCWHYYSKQTALTPP